MEKKGVWISFPIKRKFYVEYFISLWGGKKVYFILFIEVAWCCLICSEVRVEGLETLDYLDNLMRRERFTEQADAITFDEEVQRPSISLSLKAAFSMYWW